MYDLYLIGAFPMDTTVSRDGTRIAYERAGSGPAIVFVPGVFNDHTRCAELAAELSSDHTVVLYDRRGRGESGDTPPYSISREVEDLAALIALCGGSATVFGYSSGAMLALQAAVDGLPISSLVLFEPPFGFENGVSTELPKRLAAMIEAGQPDEAVALFQTSAIGLPADVVAQIRQSPMWPGLVAMAQSTVYDATITSTLPAPTAEMTALTLPTLIMNGAQTWPVLLDAAHRLAKLMPGARHVEVPAANHDIPTAETAAVIRAS
jgi:pimeloyl-ACP methyl ester carboxylesterase